MKKRFITQSVGFALCALSAWHVAIAGDTPVGSISGATVAGSATSLPTSIGRDVSQLTQPLGSVPSSEAVTVPAGLAPTTLSLASGTTTVFSGPEFRLTVTRTSGGGFIISAEPQP